MQTVEHIPQIPAPTVRPWQQYAIDGLLGLVGALAVISAR